MHVPIRSIATATTILGLAFAGSVQAQDANGDPRITTEAFLQPASNIADAVMAPRHLNVTLGNPSRDGMHFLSDFDVGHPGALAQQVDGALDERLELNGLDLRLGGSGQSHQAGGNFCNALNLVQLAGQPDIPVATGPAEPMEYDHQFPASIRNPVDELFGIKLPDNSSTRRRCRYNSGGHGGGTH